MRTSLALRTVATPTDIARWNQVDITSEEAGVDLDRVLGKGHHPCPGMYGGERLVEGEMAVLADSAEEQIDAASLYDGFLVVLALFVEICGVAVEDVDVAGRNVNLVEKVPVHKAVIALRMILRNPDIFIHVEGDDILERDLSGGAHSGEFRIGVQRG